MITLIVPLLLSIHPGGSSRLRSLHSNQRGEGVISAAIAVLVMAFLGAAMWVTFDTMFTDTTQRTSDKVGEIGGQ